MSDKTEEYQTLDYVDVQTGSFISKPEDKPARHRKKQFSFRNFKEDLKKSLGSEVDYQINWSVMKDVKLSAGYSFMLGTKTMDAVKGGNHKSWQDWGWVSVNINPKVFFTKW